MKSLLAHLSQYAYYHQDRRNVATHFIGIPMIVLAIAVLLSRPNFSFFDVSFTPAMIVVVLSSLFYLSLHLVFGLAMSSLLILSFFIADYLAAQTTVIWLVSGLGLFIVGWIFQFIGHYFEGKKPAFLDDVVGLIIGPLFVFVEFLFVLGIKGEWQKQIEQFCDLKNQENEMTKGL